MVSGADLTHGVALAQAGGEGGAEEGWDVVGFGGLYGQGFTFGFRRSGNDDGDLATGGIGSEMDGDFGQSSTHEFFVLFGEFTPNCGGAVRAEGLGHLGQRLGGAIGGFVEDQCARLGPGEGEQFLAARGFRAGQEALEGEAGGRQAAADEGAQGGAGTGQRDDR